MTRLVLASGSPRRRQLLEQIGLEFEVIPSEAGECISEGEEPRKVAERLALVKARSVAKSVREGIVIGADTIVVIDGKVLGKPANVEDARKMLALLSGRQHVVITGVAVCGVPSGRELVSSEKTTVWIRRLSPEEIETYIQTGEPMDKAGAYAVQGKGSLLVTKIRGCYFNVVGLPVGLLAEMLSKFGVNVL